MKLRPSKTPRRLSKVTASVLAFFCVAILAANHSSADSSPKPTKSAFIHSAKRKPKESFKNAFSRYMQKLDKAGLNKPTEAISAHQAAKPVKELDLERIPEWDKVEDLVRFFREGRDTRFLYTDDRPDFARRSSWYYPDDGCFARAALLVQNFDKWKAPQLPAKIFIFGSLKVKTKNSPSGSVSWWYHVVPAIKVPGQKNRVFVFDPAIYARGPLELKAWIKRMSPDLDKVRVSVCSPYTYTPNSDCYDATPKTDDSARSDQLYYLDAEWERVALLGRDPEKLLGDEPHWQRRAH
ncbi:MAG: protein-glutamine glutaminase family protein [Bdellovibrionota bacterium]